MNWYLSMIKNANLSAEHQQAWFTARTDKGQTPLHQALFSGSEAVAELILEVMHSAELLEQGTYHTVLTGTSTDGVSLVHAAVMSGSTPVIRLLFRTLLEAGIENSKLIRLLIHATENQQTPLNLAIRQADTKGLAVVSSMMQDAGLTQQEYHRLMLSTDLNEQSLLHAAIQRKRADAHTSLPCLACLSLQDLTCIPVPGRVTHDCLRFPIALLGLLQETILRYWLLCLERFVTQSCQRRAYRSCSRGQMRVASHRCT